MKEINADDFSEDKPFVSLLIPFEPRMKSELGFRAILDEAAQKAEFQLLKEFTIEKANPVISKLRKIIEGLNRDCKESSIGIFVSPLLEKVYYFTYDDTLPKKIEHENGQLH